MIYIEKNENLIKNLSSEYRILDSEFKGISLYSHDYSFNLEIDFIPIEMSKCSLIRIKLIGLQKYDLFFEGGQLSYLERYKLFKLETGNFYFSIDPYDEFKFPSKKDNGVFHAKKIEGYYSS